MENKLTSRDAIELIKNEYPDQSKPYEFIKAHEDNPRTEAFGDFFQKMLDTEDPRALEDQDAEFSVTFNLDWSERLETLLTGKYDAMIGPLLTEAVGFGICWQQQDILGLLDKQKRKENISLSGSKPGNYVEIQNYVNRSEYIPKDNFVDVVEEVAAKLFRDYSRAKTKKFEKEKEKEECDDPNKYSDLKSDVFWQERRMEDASKQLNLLRDILIKTLQSTEGASTNMTKSEFPAPEPETVKELIDRVEEDNEEAAEFLERIYESHDSLSSIVSTMKDIADDFGHNNYSYIQGRAERLLKKHADEMNVETSRLSVHTVAYAGYIERWREEGDSGE